MLRNSRTPVTLNKESSIAFKLLVLSVDSINTLSVEHFIFTDAMQWCDLA